MLEKQTTTPQSVIKGLPQKRTRIEGLRENRFNDYRLATVLITSGVGLAGIFALESSRANAQDPEVTPIPSERNTPFTIEELEKFSREISYPDMYGENSQTAYIDWQRATEFLDQDGNMILGFHDQLPNIDPATFDFDWFINGKKEIPFYTGGILLDVSKTSGEIPNLVLIVAVPVRVTGEVAVVHALVSTDLGARFITIDPETGESMGIPKSVNGLPIIPFGKNAQASIKWSAEHDAILFPTLTGEVSSVRPGMPVLVRGMRNTEISALGVMFNRFSGERTPTQWLEDLQDNDTSNDAVVVMHSMGMVSAYNP
jgi:hypothetical protein